MAADAHRPDVVERLRVRAFIEAPGEYSEDTPEMTREEMTELAALLLEAADALTAERARAEQLQQELAQVKKTLSETVQYHQRMWGDDD